MNIPEARGIYAHLLDLPCEDIHIERILELPFGTLQGFRDSGKMPPEAVALFKIIKTYPWLLDVADAGFEEKIAKKILMDHMKDCLSKV